ncbi:hypothetical protein, partial [Achromobacter kerstersii]|uniref:hypothetical protein n=1 Tax=Achromobacter kerstersii TaxID=1353890 RepID=UPI000A9B4203
MSILIFVIVFVLGVLAIGPATIEADTVFGMLTGLPVSTGMAFIFYIASGAHRSRGAFIRIHRGTRKLYFIYPRQKRLHILEWDQ